MYFSKILSREKGRSGFTLIELLVVIAIIGLLASIVLASLNTARKRSRDARRISDIRQIQMALEMYFDAQSEYPDTIATLVPALLAVQPTDPATQANYPYDNYTNDTRGVCAAATGVCLYYQLGALLEDANPAFNGDRDLDGVVGTGPDGLSTAAACGADAVATAATDRCYDVVP